jgi:hypothetical protein
MDGQFQPVNLPLIREHDFESQLPVIGPLVQFVRRALYQLTAKWGVWAVIQQQNQINQTIIDLLQDYETRLIEQDRDLAHVARTVAELEIQNRYLASRLLAQDKTGADSPLE